MQPCHSYHKLFIGFVKTNFSALTVRACSRVKEAARSSRSTKNSAGAQAWLRASGDASHVSQCQVTPEKYDRREQEDGGHEEERVRVRDQREKIRIKAPRVGAKPGGPTKSLELDKSYSELIM